MLQDMSCYFYELKSHPCLKEEVIFFILTKKLLYYYNRDGERVQDSQLSLFKIHLGALGIISHAEFYIT